MKLFSFSSFLVLKNLNNNLFVFISNFFPVKFGRQSAKFYWVISSWKYGIKLDTNVLLISISCQHSSIGDKLIEETRTRKFPRNHQPTACLAGWWRNSTDAVNEVWRLTVISPSYRDKYHRALQCLIKRYEHLAALLI